jgi:hypothetical protein
MPQNAEPEGAAIAVCDQTRQQQTHELPKRCLSASKLDATGNQNIMMLSRSDKYRSSYVALDLLNEH